MTTRTLFASLLTALFSFSAALPIAVAQTISIDVSPVVPADIPGGAVNADINDAAEFAWQEFIALNWPALTTNGLRDAPDTNQPFGDPDNTGPLVWHTYRHKAEIFPGVGDPAGYDVNLPDFGYSTLPPVYTYMPPVGNGGIVPSCPDQTPVPEPSLINLDETTQIGLNYMMAGVAPTNIPPDINSFPQTVRFLAQGNQVYYEYAVNPDALEMGGDPLYTHPSPCPSDESDPGYDHTYCQAVRNLTAVSGGDGNPIQLPGFTVEFPAGTILVKGAFRELNDEEAASGRFYMTTVRYYEDIGDSENHCYHERVWGLVGLHIIHKTPTSPNFVFATFEQVDNLLTVDGYPDEDRTGRFYDPGGEVDSTFPVLIYEDADSQDGGPTLTIEGDATNEADYCQADAIGDRLFYLENSAKPALPSAGYICQNHRDHPIPTNIRLANQIAHKAIRTYALSEGFTDSPFLYYRLVNVQAEPFDVTEMQAHQPTGNRSSATYYLANIMVETDYGLQHFRGQQSAGLPTDYPANFPDFNGRDTFQNVLTFDGDQLVDTDNMGGCMGCHGVTQSKGNDFSFVLGSGRVTEPEAPEITPPGTSNPPPGAGIERRKSPVVPDERGPEVRVPQRADPKVRSRGDTQ